MYRFPPLLTREPDLGRKLEFELDRVLGRCLFRFRENLWAEFVFFNSLCLSHIYKRSETGRKKKTPVPRAIAMPSLCAPAI